MVTEPHRAQKRKRREKPFEVPLHSPLLLPARTLTAIIARRRQRNVAITFALGMALAFEVVAGAGIFFWRQPITQVDVAGIYKSRRIDDRLLGQKIDQATATYTLPIRYPDGSVQRFTLPEMGIVINKPATVAAAHSAQRVGNPLQRADWRQQTHADLVLAVDEQKLRQFLQTNVTNNAIPAIDASLSVVNGIVQETAETNGRAYTLPGSEQVVKAAVEVLTSKPTLLQTQIIKPNITRAQLEDSKNRLKDILMQKISLTIEDQILTVPRVTIGSWIVVTPQPEQHTADIAIDRDAVLRYITQTSASHVRPARTHVATTTGQIIATGNDGATTKNTASVADTIVDRLQQAQGVSAAVSFAYTTHKSIAVEPASRWIEVDLTAKRMYAYETTSEVKSFLVSAGAVATPTVTGTFAIYSKYRQQDMRGGNADGSSYFQPRVPYVNYFYKDYAIHGNYWRPTSYFGNINSSHGCVGAITTDAAWIYNWAPIGTPVVVHS